MQKSRVSLRMEAEGGEWAEDEEEKAEAEEVEKERGVMPEDEEVKADSGEVEKILMRTYLLNTVLQE